MTRSHDLALPLCFATAVTTWLTLFSWGGFVTDNLVYLGPLISGILLVAAAGTAARWARFPVLLVIPAQVLAILLFACATWGGSVLPTPDVMVRTVAAFVEAVETLNTYAAPVPTGDPSPAPVLVLGGLVCYLLVDFCAVTLRRVPVAGLPLLVIYSLPTSVIGESVGWTVFVFGAAGFLCMLALQEGSRVQRWGRRFGAPEDSDRPGAFGGEEARRHPIAIGATATALAVFVPLAIPTFDLALFGGGGGGGGAGREVKITNPMTDLRRDLVRGEDVPLVRITTKSGRAPSYLRTAVLTTFTGHAWTPGDRELPRDHAATGALPDPVGLDKTVPRTTEKWELEVTEDLESLWLPIAEYSAAVRAGASWRYDSDTLDVFSSGGQTTAGMDYGVTVMRPELDATELAYARPAPYQINRTYLELPDGFPGYVRRLAREVVGDRVGEFEQARALQAWFRDPDRFTYSTDRDPGNGQGALVEFLSPDGRVGYCEQFASSMAVMARSLGIPARVAVGFLQPEQIGENRFEFSSHDLHAWPELYFDGFGWVRFEPTPQDRATSIPDYTNQRIGPDPAQEPSGNASRDIPNQHTQRAESSSAPPTADSGDRNGAADDDHDLLAVILWGGGGILLLGALALAPRALRRRRSTRRWHRLRGGPVETAWAELRDTAVDLGLGWPPGRSPRETARWLAESLGQPLDRTTPERPQTGPEVNPRATEALYWLVGALEEHRYAVRAPETPREEVREALDCCRDALTGGVTRSARARATWLPASVLGRSRRPASGSRRKAAGKSRGTPIGQDVVEQWN